MKASPTQQTSQSISFARARLPQEFRAKDASLTRLGEKGKKVLDWIEIDGLSKVSERGMLLQVIGKSSDSRSLLYLTARALILRSIPVRCVYPTELFVDRMTQELRDDLDSRGLLLIDRMGVDGAPFIKREDAFDIEVFLERWLGSGKSLLIRSEVSIEKNEQWSESFRFFARNRLAETFIVG